VRHRLKVNPADLAALILLSRQDISDKVVSVEKPPASEYIQNVKNRGGVGFLNPQGGRMVSTRVRRERRSHLQLLVGKREDWGG
jgi:hypothetical protein